MFLHTESVLLLLCAISMALVYCQGFQTWSNDVDDVLAAYNTKDNAERYKRGTTIVGRGLSALGKLLKGTENVPTTSKDYRKYVKYGDFETAKKDFFSVGPTNVRQRLSNPFRVPYRTGRIISGKVGDKRLILTENAGGDKAVIEVIETKFEPGPYIDKIAYQIKKD